MRITRPDLHDGPARVGGRLRFVLGMAQMATATIALVLLVATGVSGWSIAAAVTACALTSLSVVLFGGWQRRK